MADKSTPEIVNDSQEVKEKMPTAVPATGSLTTADSAYQNVTFETKEFHNIACCIPAILCCDTIDLTAGPDEVQLDQSSCLGICTSTKKLPYGELSGVGYSTCCGLKGFTAGNLSREDGDGETPFLPGWGCNGDYVTEIVEELKSRQYHRGDAAKMRTLEKQNLALFRIEKKLDALINAQNVEIEPNDVLDGMSRS